MNQPVSGCQRTQPRRCPSVPSSGLRTGLHGKLPARQHAWPSRYRPPLWPWLCLLMLLTGCSSPQLRVDLHSTANLNLSDDGQPLPVVVRVYQLSDLKAFEDADFRDLWLHDLQALGDTALSRKELILNPAQQADLQLQRHPEAVYLGAVAIFREPSDPAWRDVTPLPKGYVGKRMDQRLTVSLRGNQLTIQE